MKSLRPIAVSAAIAGVAWMLAQARPAVLRSVRVTAWTQPSDRPAVAHLAIDYAPGLRPINLICHVHAAEYLGSITLDGLTLYADLPLEQAPTTPTPTWSIETIAYYRILGRTITQTDLFTSS
ncbi:MAG: hypothetical protein Fur005_18840 [Roseiflexaceae bacterium]